MKCKSLEIYDFIQYKVLAHTHTIKNTLQKHKWFFIHIYEYV